MRHKKRVILGIILILAGVGGMMAFGWSVMEKHLNGIFVNIQAHSPNQPFAALGCPAQVVNAGEDLVFGATLTNTTDATLEYSLAATRWQPGQGWKLERQDKINLPSHLSFPLGLEMKAVEAQTVVVVFSAVSSQDEALPGPYHNWPTSYSQQCVTVVLAGPLTWQMTLALLSAVVVAGVILLVWGIRAGRGRI